MDTLDVAVAAAKDLGLRPDADRLTGVIEVVIVDEATGEHQSLLLEALATGVRLSAPGLARTGGPDGKFDPRLGAMAAVLAYDLDVQIGADTRDGELVMREVVSLVGVGDEHRIAILRDALRVFVGKQRCAARTLGYRRALAAGMIESGAGLVA